MNREAMCADVLHSVLRDFPAVDHAFAYGSGVFTQPGLYEAPRDGAGGGESTSGVSGGSSAGAQADRPMLDFIFAVEDPVAWHEEVRCNAAAAALTCAWPRHDLPADLLPPSAVQNLRRHPHHYSFLGWLGPAALTAVADRLGAGVYFNTLVPWQPHQVTAVPAGHLPRVGCPSRHPTTSQPTQAPCPSTCPSSS